MLFLDHFFLFMGMNGYRSQDGQLQDQTQYLFLMKANQIKSEFKLHDSIMYFEKNVDNRLGGKNLLTLG